MYDREEPECNHGSKSYSCPVLLDPLRFIVLLVLPQSRIGLSFCFANSFPDLLSFQEKWFSLLNAIEQVKTAGYYAGRPV